MTPDPSHKFIARVARPPQVEIIGHNRWRLNLFPVGRLIAECAIIVLLGSAFCMWMSRYAGYGVFCIPALIVVVYAVAACQMKKLDERVRIEIAEGHLWFECKPHQQLRNAGKIGTVLNVDLSGSEDPDHSESGSSRIYILVKTDSGREDFIPLLVSQTDLRPIGKAIANTVGCKFLREKGSANIPQKLFEPCL